MANDLLIKRSDPKMPELFRLHKKDIHLSMNCHAIATIESFDAQSQTCEATLNYKKTYYLPDPETNQLVETHEDYPVLVDVPVIMLRGGSSGITFPVKKGDQCLILFNDRSLDEWFDSGKVLPLIDFRTHDLADGIALVGLSHSENSLQNYDEQNTVIYNGQTKIVVKAQKVLVRNNTESLNTILQDLITALKGITTNPVSPGNPATLNAGSISSLTSIATRLGGLLE